jgi:hypothetical protein
MPMFRALFLRELRAGLIWEGTILGVCLVLAYLVGTYAINPASSSKAEWTAVIYNFAISF